MKLISKYLNFLLAIIICMTSFNSHALTITSEQKEKGKKYAKYAAWLSVPVVVGIVGYMLGKLHSQDSVKTKFTDLSDTMKCKKLEEETGTTELHGVAADSVEENEENAFGTSKVSKEGEERAEKFADREQGRRKQQQRYRGFKYDGPPKPISPVEMDKQVNSGVVGMQESPLKGKARALRKAMQQNKLTIEDASWLINRDGHKEDSLRGCMANFALGNFKTMRKRARRFLNPKRTSITSSQELENTVAGLLIEHAKLPQHKTAKNCLKLLGRLAEKFPDFMTAKDQDLDTIITTKFNGKDIVFTCYGAKFDQPNPGYKPSPVSQPSSNRSFWYWLGLQRTQR